MSVSVFGEQPKGLVAFEDAGAGGGDDFTMSEHVGRTAIFTVHGPKEVQTKFGPKTAISADVQVVGGNRYSDVLIFSQVPVDQLKASTGQQVVAAIDSYETKTGNRAPRLVAPTAEQLAAAEKAIG